MGRFPAIEKLKYLREGRYVPGDCGSPIDQKPGWLDLEKFHRGRRVYLDNYFSANLGVVVGHYWMSQVPSLVMPLMYTGNSWTVQSVCSRFQNTNYHYYYWHYGDVWNPSDEGHHSIKSVRKLHGHIAQRMNSINCPFNTDKTPDPAPPHWISQYDMAITQFTHLGANILFPEKLGFSCTDEGLMSLLHFWAGIGYLLGIDDRFNLCLQCDTLEDTRALFTEIMEQEVKTRLTQPKVEYDHILKNLSLTLRSQVDVFADHDSLLRLSFELIGLPIPESETWTTSFCRKGRSLIIRNAHTPILGSLINTYAWYQLWRQTEIYKKGHCSTGQLWMDAAKLCFQGIVDRVKISKKEYEIKLE